MAVTDFGTRRFADSEPRRARSYSYQHQAQADYEDDYGWYDEDQAEQDYVPEGLGARLGRLTHYLGAVVSVILLIGLVVWGYKLVARDVSGVPVIRAVQGEARTAPDEPGGELTRNGGLTVNEVAAGVAMPPNAEIAIAPAPTGLADDDVAMGELADPAAIGAVADEVAPVSPQNPVVAMTDAEAALSVDGQATDLGSLGIVSVDDLAISDDSTLAATEAEATVTPTVAPGPRPAPRPASIAARAQAAPATRTAEAAPATRPAIEAAVAEAATEEEVPAPAPERASVASGSPVVQLGAFDSDAIADSEWGRISGRFSSLFSGKAQVVQTTEKNGRTFYRLRVAGFDSRDDARRFCAALLAEGADCIATQQ
ncbi:SPOR domain-containing protein [Paracoccus aurantiacus]|uniref:SPOR domain-containing protein n=1 Tax=Paracoccus aurantiacus TaxID=2599412 RepID=A0A5C6S794_9RHOB|nr:SPOR domain-containing protein [Paracoccus aurantiacus]TXB70377.1 SPOR domain-containing protein [Paracoccus aurantiacus]